MSLIPLLEAVETMEEEEAESSVVFCCAFSTAEEGPTENIMYTDVSSTNCS